MSDLLNYQSDRLKVVLQELEACYDELICQGRGQLSEDRFRKALIEWGYDFSKLPGETYKELFFRIANRIADTENDYDLAHLRSLTKTFENVLRWRNFSR